MIHGSDAVSDTIIVIPIAFTFGNIANESGNAVPHNRHSFSGESNCVIMRILPLAPLPINEGTMCRSVAIAGRINLVQYSFIYKRGKSNDCAAFVVWRVGGKVLGRIRAYTRCSDIVQRITPRQKPAGFICDRLFNSDRRYLNGRIRGQIDYSI